MIEVNCKPIGATIGGTFYPLAPRLAKALELLVNSKGLPVHELVPGRDKNSQKVCIHQLRAAIRGSGYTIISTLDGGFLLISEQLNL